MEKKDSCLIELQAIDTPNDPPTNTSPGQGKDNALPYDPSKLWLGWFYQILYILQLCMNQFLGKVLFIRHPDLALAELITIRQSFAILVLIIIVNKRLKEYIIDNVPRSQIKNLAVRCI